MKNVDFSMITDPKLRFYLLVKDAFDRLPEGVDKVSLTASEFKGLVLVNDKFGDLREFMCKHGLSIDSWWLADSFFHVQRDWKHWESFVGHCFEDSAGYLRFAAYEDGKFAMELHGGPGSFVGFVGTPEQVAQRYEFGGSLRENFFDMDYIMPPLTEEEVEMGQPVERLTALAKEAIRNPNFWYAYDDADEKMRAFADNLVEKMLASQSVDGLISRATTISEQSKETASRPNMLRDGIEIG